MSKGLPALLFLCSLCACSGDDDTGPSSGSSACKVDGTYVASYTADPSNPSTCPGDVTPDTVTVVAEGASAEVAISALGGSCPALVDGCKLTAKCDLKDANGAQIGTVQLSWTFSRDGFKGYSSYGLQPPAVTQPCTYNLNTDGEAR